MAKICVFCSSSENLSEEYVETAKELGSLLGVKGYELVYGGSHRGLMGEVSNSFSEHSNKITEIIPKIFENFALKRHECIVTEDFGERLNKMQKMSDAFISLSGGVGSLHETLDVLLAKQVKLHNKPLVIINTKGFYDPLIMQFKRSIEEGFSPKDNHQLIKIVSTPKEAMDYIESYIPQEIEDKCKGTQKLKTLPKVGIGVMIKKDGKILFGKRKGSHGSGSWSFPGGHLEFGESFEDCATRETLEETGITIKNLKFLTATNDVFEKKHYITVFVAADYDSGELKLMEPDKCEEWKWVEVNNLPNPLFAPIKNLVSIGLLK